MFFDLNELYKTYANQYKHFLNYANFCYLYGCPKEISACEISKRKRLEESSNLFQGALEATNLKFERVLYDIANDILKLKLQPLQLNAYIKDQQNQKTYYYSKKYDLQNSINWINNLTVLINLDFDGYIDAEDFQYFINNRKIFINGQEVILKDPQNHHLETEYIILNINKNELYEIDDIAYALKHEFHHAYSRIFIDKPQNLSHDILNANEIIKNNYLNCESLQAKYFALNDYELKYFIQQLNAAGLHQFLLENSYLLNKDEIQARHENLIADIKYILNRYGNQIIQQYDVKTILKKSDQYQIYIKYLHLFNLLKDNVSNRTKSLFMKSYRMDFENMFNRNFYDFDDLADFYLNHIQQFLRHAERIFVNRLKNS